MRKISSCLILLGAVAWAASCGGSSVTPAGDQEAGASPDGASRQDGAGVPDAVVGQDAAPDATGPDGNTEKDSGLDASTDSAADAEQDSGQDSGRDAAIDAAPDAQPDAGPPPSVQIIGRTDARDPAGPKVGWPAARIIARFNGTEATVRLSHVNGFSGGPSYYDVLVDGVLVGAPLAVTGGVTDYPLVTGLPAGDHTVELYKRTEASLGVDQLHRFTFAGGRLLSPPPRAARRIEFLGDSQIQGFGVESTSPTCATIADKHNARKSVQALLGADLGAEVSSITYSGKGLGKNEFAGDTRYFRALYPLSLPDDNAATWNFANFVPDVIVIVLGGTDFSVAPIPTAAQFRVLYQALLTQVRSLNPDAFVFGVIGGQIKDSFPAGQQLRTRMRGGIDMAIASLADPKMFRFQLPESNPALETACYNHASEALHLQWATMLGTEIRLRTGW